MGFLNKYKTDKTAEKTGVWVEIDAGVEIKVARLSNDKAREMRKTLEKPYRNFRDGPPDSKSEEILRTVIAHTVLLDWKGMTGEDGEALAYSPETAEKLFKDYPDFLGDVVSVSAARETYQAEATEAVKNG